MGHRLEIIVCASGVGSIDVIEFLGVGCCLEIILCVSSGILW